MSEFDTANYLNEDGILPLVKENDDGIRPAGEPDECFYCHSKVGEPHKFNCVTVCKNVKVRATIEYVKPVPVSWDKEMIEFHHNQGTYCANNIVKDLQEYIEYLDKDDDCLCQHCNFEVIDEVE